MSMNPFLAELYGTAQVVGAGNNETEKLAQAAILDQMLSSDGYDVSQMPGDAILKVAHEIFGPGNEIEKLAAEGAGEGAAPGASETPAEETAEEKIAMADFLGRTMAHAYVNELSNIEKQAGGLVDASGKALKSGKTEVGRQVGRLVDKAKHHGGKHLENLGTSIAHHARGAASKLGLKPTHGPISSGAAKAVGAGAYGAGAAGAAGAGYAAKKHMDKKGSAVEFLAQKEAAQLLADNGIDPSTLTPAGQNFEEKLASDVTARRNEILAELGFTVE